jgi:hypothetical protein
VLAGSVLYLTPALLAQAANSCTDPYWKDTLRCAFFPAQPPQPNIETPATVEDVLPFTRVFFDDPDLRCVDGTRPLMYIDKAVCTEPGGCDKGVRYGQPVDSNRWMFTMPGGGGCHAESCGAIYADPAERGEMGTAGKAPLKSLNGIHDPDPEMNPVFAGYNRVRVEKCGFDRYQGRRSHEAAGGYFAGTLPDGTPYRYNLYHHGYLMLEEAFHVLERGLHYSTWRRNEAAGQPPSRRRACCGASGEKIIVSQERLPPLADAEVVLLVGHSGGSHGLFHNIDNLAASLASLPGFRGDVRALFDENFVPSLENEAAFASTAPPGSDAYSGITSGRSTSSVGPFTYDGAVHYEIDVHRVQYDAWGAGLDESCLEVHDGPDLWKCRDRHHVVMNHVATPFFFHEDFSDPNREHLNRPVGHEVRWGDEADYSNCPTSDPCNPTFDPIAYRARLEAQSQALLRFATTRSEMARGIDTSYGPAGGFPTFYAWMTDCQNHEGAYLDDTFFRSTISTSATSYTMRQWLEEFMNVPRLGAVGGQIAGSKDASGRIMRMSRCR